MDGGMAINNLHKLSELSEDTSINEFLSGEAMTLSRHLLSSVPRLKALLSLHAFGSNWLWQKKKSKRRF